MAILSTLLAMSEPSGMWETIIKAFEGFTGNYILAILLLTVIIRIVWAPFDLINRRQSSKMSANQAKMQPELDKITKKYENNPQLLNQKKNELYKKYNGNAISGCLFMLVFMGLNIAIFITLLTGINTMSAYKTYTSYENVKYDYANCLVLADEYMTQDEAAAKAEFKDYEDLTFVISGEGEDKVVKLMKGETELKSTAYKTDFSTPDDPATEDVDESVTTNAYLGGLIETYITPQEPIILQAKVEDGEGNVTTPEITFATAFQTVAEKVVESVYTQNQDGFLWIKNIWVADSPVQNSIVDYSGFAKTAGAANLEEGEELVFNTIMTPLRQAKGEPNGYFILPILCVVVCFLSTWLASRPPKGQPAPQNGKAMKIIMPIIFGSFALFYSSVFALYMVTGQIISTLLLPLQTMIIRKWNDHDDKKKKEKVEVVEYSRKF